MELVLRSWRERVEHDAPGLSADSSRWRVRKPPRQTQQGPRRRQQAARRARPARNNRAPVRPPPTAEKKFATAQLDNFGKTFAESYKWSPWRENNDARQRPDAPTTDEAQLRRWKLRGDMLRLATYYRVMRLHDKATRRVRREAVQRGLRAWAKRVLREARADTGEMDTEEGARPSRKRKVTYKETRTNKQRTTPEEMTTRRLAYTRRRHGCTASDVQLGKRQRDEMTAVARRCVRRSCATSHAYHDSTSALRLRYCTESECAYSRA